MVAFSASSSSAERDEHTGAFEPAHSHPQGSAQGSFHAAPGSFVRPRSFRTETFDRHRGPTRPATDVCTADTDQRTNRARARALELLSSIVLISLRCAFWSKRRSRSSGLA